MNNNFRSQLSQLLINFRISNYKTLSVVFFAIALLTSHFATAQLPVTYDFESGLQGWTSNASNGNGNNDSGTYYGWGCNANRSIYSKDDDGSNNIMMSPAIDLTSYSEVTISFCHKSININNNKGFRLQYYNGSNWTTIKHFRRGTDFFTQGVYAEHSFSRTITDGATYVFTANSRFRFRGTSSDNNDWNFFDDVTITGVNSTPCAQPANQPTNLTFSNVLDTSMDISFTPATSSPDGYLVVYNTTGVTPPVADGATYTVGATYGDHTVVSDNTDTTFTLTGLNNNTTYYVYVFSYNALCSGGPNYLNSSPLNGNETTLNYCIPNGTNSSFYIDDFSTSGGVTNITNNNSGYSANGYGNFTNLSVSQYRGSAVNFYGNFEDGSWSYDGFGVGVWVDFNNDGDFNDAGETVFNYGYYDPINSSFTIPESTTPGDYQMRIVIDWNTGNPYWCSSSFIGEAEDYTLTVLDIVTCTPSDGVGTTSLACPSVNAGGLGLSGADPDPINCSVGNNTTTLEATYLDLGDTSTYNVESIPYAPPFQFSCLENPVSVNDDDVWSPEIDLPFDFCFFGTTYDSCVIGSNGVISFNSSLANGPTGWRTLNNIPTYQNASGYFYGPSIHGVHHDVDPSVGGEIGYQLITLDTGCRALVAAWSDVPMYDDNSLLYTGMIVFYEDTNIIEVYVKEKRTLNAWNDGNATIGLQANGSTAVVAPNRNARDANWTAFDEAWRFVPAGPSITTLKWYKDAISPANEINDPNNDGIITVTPTETTTYYSEVTYDLCSGSSIVEIDTATITLIGDKVWDGSESSDWNNPNNWTPAGVPVITDCIVIPVTANNPVITGVVDGIGFNMEIEDGATLIQQPNSSLTIEDKITIDTNADYELKDSASLIQITDVATNQNVGTAKVQREVNGLTNFDFVYWSTPVEAFDVGDVSPSTPNYGIFEWLPTVDNGSPGKHGEWSYATGNMTLGKGYAIRDLEGTAIANTAQFEGKLNNGQITHYITRGVYNGMDYPGNGNTATAEDDNWNLIGNPYPSAISLTDFTTANPYIDGTLYFWRHTAPPSTFVGDPFYTGFQYNYSENDYLSANSLGSTPPGFNGYIAAGQGFFVQLLNSSPRPSPVVFNNTMRGTYANDGFYRSANLNADNTSNTNQKHRIWLDLIDSNNSALSLLVGYAAGATDAIDRLYDGHLLNDSNYQFYSTLNTPEKTNKLAIHGKALPFEETDTIPLGFQTPTQGQYTIALNTVDGLFETTDQGIYLEDKVLDIIHDLRTSPYSFTTDLGTFEDRFVLRFNTDNSLSVTDLDANANLDIRTLANAIVATATKSLIKTFELHDITGRLIHKKLNITAADYSYPTQNLSRGTYIVTVSLANGTTASKKLII
ncbi:fibronectin type III domain-containing protein [Winogradskyella psychrotolerans]|uniref:GEVED domain-containing protein n=1 Tax=Winogradskyella psychrotolerans TaxID=1344585 RepID=UPI001C07BC2C|nr:GEVED domain-containing protein [Winogradskyella psychrotolerans]MBU2922872.1 fibronectin type III domain-containing protein [Winogradskyella psychrotolerans]